MLRPVTTFPAVDGLLKTRSFCRMLSITQSFLAFSMAFFPRNVGASEIVGDRTDPLRTVVFQEAARIDEEEYSFHGIHTVDFPVPGGPVITIILPRSIFALPSTSCSVHLFTTIQ